MDEVFPELTEDVIARMKNGEPRLREVVTLLVRHLHAFAREASLTQDEWRAGIDFLTRTGQKCSESRQEFILLSDILGVSMLVDAIATKRVMASRNQLSWGRSTRVRSASSTKATRSFCVRRTARLWS